MDKRPICNCDAYKFPHRIGGKCKGEDFLYYSLYSREFCELCNCFNNGCEVIAGIESIKHAECYIDQLESNPGGHLPSLHE